jgi:2-polyprenyl-3-methyl-5-hydroxy-6-metoxy-1,4-benzoquinol methylase
MLVFETLQAHQRTNALRAAIELKLFTAIAKGAKTPEALAPVCNASEKGLRILCDFLTVVGFLTKDESGYSNTPDTQLFLVTGSPAYMGGMTNFLFHPFMEKGLSHILEAVRLGGTVLPAEGTVSEDNPVWIDFARGMAPLTIPSATLIAELTSKAGPLKVLDIAAGHGMFGITIAKRNLEAEIYALDWKNVLAVAHENATKLGVADRWHAIEGDAFTADCGTGYDLVLVTNFVHHFDIPTNVTLLKKLHSAMKPEATLVILEMAVNDDRVTPPSAALFAMTMLTSTRSGDAFSRRELESMCEQAGFKDAVHHEVPHTPSTITLAKT